MAGLGVDGRDHSVPRHFLRDLPGALGLAGFDVLSGDEGEEADDLGGNISRRARLRGGEPLFGDDGP
ncbi:MAG: hypothetical protein ACYCST_16050 [Acidimicrobiales bacterium]